MYKVFDIHTHTYPESIASKATENLGRFYNFKVKGEGTYSDLESQSAENNVKGYLLFSVATNPHQVEKVNTSIAELSERSRNNGFLTVGFMGMHHDYPDFEKEITRSLGLGLKGVKIHPDIQQVNIDDERLFELYDLIAGKIPLYLHMGDDRPQYRYSEAERLVRVLKMFPKLEVVAAHLGGYRSWDVSVPLLSGRENVWYDTSSALWAMSSSDAEKIISVLGSERIMFGTDYPVVNTHEELERFYALKLSERQREDILFNNAVRFLHLEDRVSNAL